jgi:non-heme chloroperoxidase
MDRLVRATLVVSLLAAAVAFPSAIARADQNNSRSEGFVTTPDHIQIRYIAAGTFSPAPGARPQPVILFVPGWTMPAWIWDAQIDYFSKRFRVVAIDPRSQGQSTKTPEGNTPDSRAGDIDAVIQTLHLGPVVLVGWSQGVLDVLSYFKKYGTQNVAGFALVDGFPGLDVDGDTAKGFIGFNGQLLNNRQKFVERFVRSMYKTPQTEEYIARVIAASLETPTAMAVAESIALLTTDSRAVLGTIDRPTIIFTPKGGQTVSIEEDMQKRISKSEIVEMPGVGHALFVDDSKTFNERLERFADALVPAATSGALVTPAAATPAR